MTALKTPIKKAKGLGSAKEGVAHFWAQRVTALCLIPLSLWFVYSILGIIGKSQWDAMSWMGKPENSFFLMIFVCVGLYHAYLGIRTVIEDYIHCEWVKISSIIFMQVGLFLLSSATIFSILRVYFEG